MDFDIRSIITHLNLTHRESQQNLLIHCIVSQASGALALAQQCYQPMQETRLWHLLRSSFLLSVTWRPLNQHLHPSLGTCKLDRLFQFWHFSGLGWPPSNTFICPRGLVDLMDCLILLLFLWRDGHWSGQLVTLKQNLHILGDLLDLRRPFLTPYL